MPTGYYGQGKKFIKKLGKWVDAEKEKTFDYDNVNAESAAFIISFFRWYPDYLCDIFRSPNAKYKLQLPQRIMMRILARYRKTYITGVRGLTKTYVVILESITEGILFPGKVMRYVAPNQKQAASLATKAFHDIEKDYPVLTSMWNIKNDREDMFRIETSYGSQFTMYAPRGDTADEVIGEECGQEGEQPFPMEAFEADIIPVVRGVRMINGKIDPIHINQKHIHIGNACSRQNKAYTKLRYDCLRAMLYDENKQEGYAIDISWITALLGNLRDITYFKDLKSSLTQENWLRECGGRYTGNTENPLLPDEIISRSRKIKCMEEKHSGDTDAIYIVSHDVSYESGAKNAKCADVVFKLTRFKNIQKRDKYRKQAVFVDSYAPPATEYLQAMKLKALWAKFCLDTGKTTYLVVDARAVGKTVVQELMKPSGDGLPTLSCINGEYAEIEQPHALRVIYPIKAGTAGSKDADGEMIRYAQREWEQGNVELLTSSILDGVEAYKNLHGIKDDYSDGKIAMPYRKTDELCVQIANLKTDVSGLTLREKRRSAQIQRDDWSAAKYGLRMAQILESLLVEEQYTPKSSWKELLESGKNIARETGTPISYNERTVLLKNRKR